MTEKPARGKILISEPFLIDPNFKRTIIILTEHNDDGSIGFVLNRPLQNKLNEVIEDFPEFDAPIYYGGPVQLNTIHFLHRAGDMVEDSIEILDGLYWGGSYEHLKLLIEAKAVEPKDFIFFIGYSGWAEEQLNDEMESNSWILHDAKAEDIFSDDPEHLWQNVLKSKGKKFAVLSSFPENPGMN